MRTRPFTRSFASTLAVAAAACHAPRVPDASVASTAPGSRTVAEVLAATTPSDWETLRPEHVLVIDLPKGRVVIELAEAFAPQHVANVHAAGLPDASVFGWNS